MRRLILILAASLIGGCKRQSTMSAPISPKQIPELRAWAEKGDARSQTVLGAAYLLGTGVPKDEFEAVKWFRKAAEQGDADGHCTLGIFYAGGIGLPKDEAEAVKQFRQGAEQSHPESLARLGAMYANGLGLPKDEVEAYKWFLLASKQGHKVAKARCVDLEHNLTPEQRAEGERRAREFKPAKAPAAARQ